MPIQKEVKTAIARLASAGVLMACACVLYVGFVATLFAGFTADIQRDMLSRVIGASSPGELERTIHQSFHEAELRDEVTQLRAGIRKTNMDALEKFRDVLTLRNEVMLAWLQAYDAASKLRTTITQNQSLFAPDFVTAYQHGMTAADDFIAQFQPQQDISTFQATGDKQRDDPDAAYGLLAEDGARSVAALRGALINLAFTGTDDDIGTTVVTDFEQQVHNRADALGQMLLSFDDKNIRARIEWTNIQAEQAQVDKILANMQARLDDIADELARGEAKKKIDLSALVALFQNPIGAFWAHLVQLPTIMLTLLVTVAAGGLGAVVAFTRRNFGDASKRKAPIPDPAETTEPTHTADQATPAPLDVAPDPAKARPNAPYKPRKGLMASARLLMMTGEGVAAAIAIFLFAEAGMLMLYQGGPNSSGQVDISPYLVTFMAFVSGFMAEDAFNRIQDAGQKIFKIRDKDDVSGMGL